MNNRDYKHYINRLTLSEDLSLHYYIRCLKDKSDEYVKVGKYVKNNRNGEIVEVTDEFLKSYPSDFDGDFLDEDEKEKLFFSVKKGK